MVKTSIFAAGGFLLGVLLFFSFGPLFGGAFTNPVVVWVLSLLLFPNIYLSVLFFGLTGLPVGAVAGGVFIFVLVVPITYALIGYCLGRALNTDDKPLLGATIGTVVLMVLSAFLLQVSVAVTPLGIKMMTAVLLALPAFGMLGGYYAGKKLQAR